jgi:PAS domain S-box-containing protein
MSVLRRFLPKSLLLGLILFMAIVPRVEAEAEAPADPLTPEERAFVAAHGPIRYAPDPLFPPFEFLDSSGVARGITPDLLTLMGKKLGVEFRTAAYLTWSDILEAVKRGKVDLLGTLTRTPEREGYLIFSKPYLSVSYVLFVRQGGVDPKNIEGMVSRRLGVVKNYGINTWLSAVHPKIHPVVMEDTATGLTMVATGQLDAMLEALPVGAQIVRKESLTNIRIMPRLIETLPQHFGVRKEEPLLLSIVQKGLDSLTEAERSEVFVRWTGQDFSRPPPAISPLLRNALIILVAASVLSWSWITALRHSVRRATESLRESEERYRELFENASDIIYTHDLAGNFTSINKAAEQATGYTLDEALKININAVIAPEYVVVARQMMSRKVAEGDQTRYELEIVSKDGRRVPIEARTRFIYRGGKPVGVQGIARDIAERKQAEEALRASQKMTEEIINAIPVRVFWKDRNLVYLGCNSVFASDAGFTDPKDIIGKDDYQMGWRDQAELYRADDRQVIESGGSKFLIEEPQTTSEGNTITLLTSKIPLRNSNGEIGGMIGTYYDITARKRAEAEKEKLQAQLQQAMKMEAVGRLAGGVAHDFNNLLTVIIGYSELLLQKIGKESTMHRDVEEIKRAAERAASLTQQLLAFSRKQIIEPKVVRLDLLVADMQAMLTRLIGEDIALQATTGKSPGSVKVDPGQFQQILMNLVVNARDAMPDGGKIVVETANVDLDDGYCAVHPYIVPGRFVMLSVSDTGHGMSEEVKAHIFEPFFTTKEKGRGTGLGLATTYGVVKQSGGSIEVYSEDGIGTTYKIYLPRVEEEVSPSVMDDRPQDMRGGSETVLLVEDEDIVRNLCVRILERLGYKVLQARNGDEAIVLAQGYGDRIDLLLTDVVMPGMNGAELARQLVLHHPQMKVLFTSGYTDDAIVRHGILEEGVSFIGKPYTPSALAKKVRGVLDR